ncbi:MAG: toll/interleukin-1 receptor domain-containing protein [Gammaproteobacteria bacterium]|nr:toll/interleukin-1 receptor domain-containing protein [Gammaproteobacteria bacterium]
MPDYEYHIFISYRRSDDDWVRWTRNNFVKPLRSLLRPALGDVSIFVDEQIETGDDWPMRLARALARSRLLIPVLSRDYFNSEWCRIELAHMYEREQQSGLRTLQEPDGLILPFVIDDGNSFPPKVQAMQGEKIHKFANPWVLLNSPRQEEFAAHLHSWCPCVEQALQRVPTYDSTWENLAYDQLQNQFQIHVADQTVLPGLSLNLTARSATTP